jgi:hypothetical protein
MRAVLLEFVDLSVTPSEQQAIEASAAVAAPSRWRRWLSDPLLHFLVLGSMLFVGDRLVHPQTGAVEAANHIRRDGPT